MVNSLEFKHHILPGQPPVHAGEGVELVLEGSGILRVEESKSVSVLDSFQRVLGLTLEGVCYRQQRLVSSCPQYQWDKRDLQEYVRGRW